MFIYSVSEDPDGEDSRYLKYEKIGKTNNLAIRLYEHNHEHASSMNPFVYNWYFQFDIDSKKLRKIEGGIHELLRDRKVMNTTKREFFRKNTDLPSCQIIKKYLDEENIEFKFCNDCKDIKPCKKFKRKHKKKAKKIHSPIPVKKYMAPSRIRQVCFSLGIFSGQDYKNFLDTEKYGLPLYSDISTGKVPGVKNISVLLSKEDELD